MNCNGDFFCGRVLFTFFHHAEPELPKLKKIEAVIDLT